LTSGRARLLRIKYSSPNSQVFRPPQAIQSSSNPRSVYPTNLSLETKLLLQLSHQLDILLLGICGGELVFFGDVLPCVVFGLALIPISALSSLHFILRWHQDGSAYFQIKSTGFVCFVKGWVLAALLEEGIELDNGRISINHAYDRSDGNTQRQAASPSGVRRW